MRKMFCMIFGLSSMVGILNAQPTLKVEYLEQTKIPKNADYGDNPEIAKMVEAQLKSMAKTMQLICSQTESIFKPAIDKSQAGGQSTVKTMALGGSSMYYKNKKEGVSKSQENIIDRQFLVADTLPKFSWTLTEEEKEVCGYPCQKATLTDGTIAWYTLAIPVNDGPHLWWGLPGLILELEGNTKVYIAQNINLSYADKSELKEPTEGKKISRSDFNSLLKKKKEEMGIKDGENSGGVRVIKM